MNGSALAVPGGAYFRMKYISQLAAITELTNSTQQYTP